MNFHKVTLGFYHYALLIVKRYKNCTYNKILFILVFIIAKIFLLIKKSKSEFIFSHKIFPKLQTAHATITG